jgi:septum formation protein
MPDPKQATTPPIYPWRLILASASPRRRQLLKGLDLAVTITTVDVDETPPENMPHENVAAYLAQKKAEAWTGKLKKDQVLLTADTTVLVDGQLLNKPADDEDAVRMLGLLAGRTHKVITGVCMLTSRELIGFSDESLVTFGSLSQDEIRYYVAKYRPMDKAGSYGVQDWIGYAGVQRIEGSFYNVMGLPLHRVYDELRKIPVPE